MADEETTPETEPQEDKTQPQPGLDPKIYADDGKTWKEKFYGEQGRRGQVEAESAKALGGLQQQIKALQEAKKADGATIARLEATVAELEGQTGAIPELQEQVTSLSSKAEMADKLNVLMKYPKLLGYQVTEERTIEGEEEPVEEIVRPFLNLIQSTTLTGEALEKELVRLAKALPGDIKPSPSPETAGAAPSPPEPAGDGDSPDHWHEEAMKWHQMHIAGETGPNGEDPAKMEQEAWNKKREAIQRQLSSA